MDILYLLVPLSIVLVFAIGAFFWWAIDRGQFEDLEGPAHAILLDDDVSADKRCAIAGARPTALDADQHTSPQ